MNVRMYAALPAQIDYTWPKGVTSRYVFQINLMREKL